MQLYNKIITESMIQSLGDYLELEKDNYIIKFWISAKLRPYLLQKDEFEWIKYPVELENGIYRLCFMIDMGGKRYPIIAFSAIYPASIRKYPHHPLQYISGTGFHFSPICVTSEKFTLATNISDFTIRKSGKFNICATTSNWTPQVLNTSFELLLMQKRSS